MGGSSGFWRAQPIAPIEREVNRKTGRAEVFTKSLPAMGNKLRSAMNPSGLVQDPMPER
jgi:hypothetical protein